MSVLSDELIREFANAMAVPDNKPKEATVYGTVKTDNGVKKVQLDGSSVLTPVETTVELHENDRVLVRLKDRIATVIGNLTVSDSPIHGLLKAIWVDSGPFDIVANTGRSIIITVVAPVGYKLVGPMHVKTNGFVGSYYVSGYDIIEDGAQCNFTLYGMNYNTQTNVTASVLVLFALKDAVA